MKSIKSPPRHSTQAQRPLVILRKPSALPVIPPKRSAPPLVILRKRSAVAESTAPHGANPMDPATARRVTVVGGTGWR